MLSRIAYAAAVVIALSSRVASASDSDISLFDGQGNATAYIAVDDDMTVYLWGGKPVAYVSANSQHGYDIYGFNGSHLGWFLNGIVWDHDGSAACATKEAMRGTKLEPIKSIKELKPVRTVKELAPLRPLLSNTLGATPCSLLLGSGAG